MPFGVFIHRSDSIYQDVPSVQYQFPKSYLSRAKRFEGDWIVYYEPTRVKDSKGYFAVAHVQEIIPDPSEEGMYLALITPNSYLDFGNRVDFKQNGKLIETGLYNDLGNISGRAQSAVREISSLDFTAIIDHGLADANSILPREDVQESSDVSDYALQEANAEFVRPKARDVVSQITNRKVRDRNFRKSVLDAYDERCAITGLKLINGGGRAEVQAAHIRPVEHDGPDLVSNGLSLSGTAHWMFDRGLVGLGSELEICISRQANDYDAVSSLINPTGKLIIPTRIANQPRREFVEWHRENIFKQ
jgi:putative restriction endonuclease